MGRKLITDKFRLLLLIFFLNFINAICAQKQSHTIKINEIQITGKLYNLIDDSHSFFDKAFGKYPNVTILEFYILDGQSTYRIWNSFFPYIIFDHFDFLNDKYIGGTYINEKLVLFKQSSAIQNKSEFIKIKNKKRKFKIYFGGDITGCMQTYIFKNDKFLLDETDDCGSKYIIR